MYDLQILGAFADHDGAPMQGMKIKNVVPGKSTYNFIACFGAVTHLHVPQKFAFYGNRYSQTFSSVAFVACCASAQIEAEFVAVVTIRGFRGFTIRSLKMISNVCHEGQLTECVLFLQFT